MTPRRRHRMFFLCFFSRDWMMALLSCNCLVSPNCFLPAGRFSCATPLVFCQSWGVLLLCVVLFSFKDSIHFLENLLYYPAYSLSRNSGEKKKIKINFSSWLPGFDRDTVLNLLTNISKCQNGYWHVFFVGRAVEVVEQSCAISVWFGKAAMDINCCFGQPNIGHSQMLVRVLSY